MGYITCVSYHLDHPSWIPISFKLSNQLDSPSPHVMRMTSNSPRTSRETKAENVLKNSNTRMPPCRVNGMPQPQHMEQTIRTTSHIFFLVVGHWSMIAVVTASVMTNCESRPKVRIIEKKRKDQRGDRGSVARAAG